MENTNLLFVDDFYFSALSDDEEIYPISDEKYAHGLMLQEALMSSVISSRMPDWSPKVEKLKPIRKKEAGESSQSFCEICMEGRPTEDMFRNMTCTHSFCTHCISKYVAVKIQENISFVKCPNLNCKLGVLEPDRCRSIIPEQVFDRWEKALCESLILGSQKFFCPFKDCSAILVDEGGMVVRESECPDCRRLFCAQCKVAWHAGIECEEFQRLNEDERMKEDLMVMELAKKKKWRRCPKCKFYVEKRDGCVGFIFVMGADWDGMKLMMLALERRTSSFRGMGEEEKRNKPLILDWGKLLPNKDDKTASQLMAMNKAGDVSDIEQAHNLKVLHLTEEDVADSCVSSEIGREEEVFSFLVKVEENMADVKCPNLDCEKLLDPLSSHARHKSLFQGLFSNRVEKNLTESSHLNCKTLFSFQCNLPRHTSYQGDESDEMRDENNMLAMRNEWMRRDVYSYSHQPVSRE
ncbi:hypothetical protein HHK36_014462 [Tetracentron sinense]|uniref:RBR-type E3 ubiquitin transferase n=1 Tax=Tetracentron sinense TaxID=13715 RepID=A0A835DF78_TETSI|nr:hypothetical protein HHK36_014462 [Tetracentron sinense]